MYRDSTNRCETVEEHIPRDYADVWKKIIL